MFSYKKNALLFVLLLFSVSGQGRIVESIIAIVNNDIITQTDIEKYKEKLKKGNVVDDLLVEPSAVSGLIADEDKVLEVMIKERLLDDEVKKQGLQVTVERLEKEIKSIASKNNISRDQLVQALKADGIRFSDYQDFVKTRIERQDLIARTITSKIKISEDEISTYYIRQNGGSDTNIYEYQVAHILFRLDERGEDAAFNRAKSVYLKLQNEQTTFDKLASQFSEDPNFVEGGVLGTFKAGELVGSIDQVMQKLEKGEHSKLVKTKRGFHIIKVVDKKLVPDPKMARERNRIRAILYQEAFKKQFQFWIDQKRQEAFVRINKT